MAVHGESVRNKADKVCELKRAWWVIVGAFAIIASFQLHAWMAYAGDFVVTKADSGYSVKLTGGNQKEVPLPNSKIVFGFYEYVPAPNELSTEVRLGFLAGGQTLYFLEGKNTDYGAGDPQYGIKDNYLIVDTFADTASHRRFMFLFKFGVDSVTYLDCIAQPYLKSCGFDFMSWNIREPPIRGVPGVSFPIEVPIYDMDGDGKIEIPIEAMLNRWQPTYLLFLEIDKERLKIDFNPKLYKELFQKEKKQSKGKVPPFPYFIYGYLSRQLSREQVKKGLESRKWDYDYVVCLMTASEKEWNEAFHDPSGTGREIRLIKYDLAGR